MKRLLAGVCLVLALIAFVVPAEAQKVSAGLKAGPNITTLAGDDVEDVTSVTRFVGGGFVLLELTDHFAFQPEVLYAQKGTKLDDPNADLKLKIDYVEIPLLLRVQTASPSARFLPHALAGPTIAFRTACEISGTQDDVELTFDCDENNELSLPVKDMDYGVAIGAGVDMATSRVYVSLEARYEWGVTDIDDSTDPSNVKNRAFSVMAGVRFPLGGSTMTSMR